MSIYHILEQDVHWQTADGIKIRLEDMDASHRANVLNYLRRRAAYNKQLYELYVDRLMMDAPDDVFNQWNMEEASSIEDSPEAWLDRRPFMRKLIRLVDEDQRGMVVDGEVVLPKQELDPAARRLMP